MDILISEELESTAIDRLAGKFSVTRVGGLWSDPVALGEQIAGARAIMIRNQTRLTAEVLERAGKLQAIGRVGVGLDNIDLAAAERLGIVVVAPLDANAVSVAELSMGLIISLARKIPRSDRSTKSGGWDRKGCTGLELAGKTLLICGFGRIGRKLAVRARAFEMRVLAFDPFVKGDSPSLRETGAELRENLEGALGEADFVSVHLPMTASTKHLFNAQTLARMKKGAFFINTSRGGVVDEGALFAALGNGHLGGAALDVREVEPPIRREDLAAMDQVILTPHVGSFTAEAQSRTFEAVAADLEAILSGQAAVNFVNFSTPRRA